VLTTLHDAIVEVGKDPDIQAKIRQQGFATANIGLGDFDAHIRGDMARLAPILAKLGPSK
jgi:tripartite-type tricarboxylate transporter receptor subunit TctC